MDDRIIKIANKYRYAAQTQMLIEEMAELTHAILKYNRSALRSSNCLSVPKAIRLENIREEIADVQIMLYQMQYLVGLSDEDLKELMDKKINRQLRRMKEGE